MKPTDRHAWIRLYLRLRSKSYPYGVNVLDAYFVDAYITRTGAPFRAQIIGADQCRQLGRDLAAMERRGELRRIRVGINAPTAGGGWPKWVWDYKLSTKENTCQPTVKT